MRPAPLLLALLLAWAALGGLVLGGLLPRWSWALAAVAIALPALFDLWRQTRRPSPQQASSAGSSSSMKGGPQ